jgi:hypothetical protein
MNSLTKSNGNIVQGSIGDIARQNNQSIAQSFVNADAIVIVDTSGSMCSHDSRDGKSRYEVACEELAALQQHMPGKIAVLSFSNITMFCPDGKPFDQSGTTDLTGALNFAKVGDTIPGMRFIVISDGQPDNSETALKVAKSYKNSIDVIYVGPEHSASGRDFLEKLAKASGGTTVTASCATNLLNEAETLLLGTG